ncbi:inositol monophosphatase family protein [Stackebrandtia soli]|uniref:inositol monophosphatase family protein n=1 Tax=Stackebrandtia soli TaxID=1892856 RepID=UPI0039E7C005
MELSDAEVAALLAEEAGAWLLKLRDERGFDDPTALRRDGDIGSHRLIMAALRQRFPDDAVLSEEGEGESGRTGSARLSASRVWIVDPLDGTREYGEAGRSDWAVHVALWKDGALSDGAVALPAAGHVLSSDAPPSPRWTDRRPRIAVSRSRPPALVESVATALDAELVPMGSAGAKVAAVVLGRVDAYVHAGGQYEWDSAAPVAVARAAGLHTSRIDGASLTYNNPDPKLTDLVVCRPDLATRLLAAIADAPTPPTARKE